MVSLSNHEGRHGAYGPWFDRLTMRQWLWVSRPTHGVIPATAGEGDQPKAGGGGGSSHQSVRPPPSVAYGATSPAAREKDLGGELGAKHENLSPSSRPHLILPPPHRREMLTEHRG